MAAGKKRNVKQVVNVKKGGDSMGPVYFFGMIGAAVFFVQQATGFGEVIVALLKAAIWPAYFVWEAFKFFWGA